MVKKSLVLIMIILCMCGCSSREVTGASLKIIDANNTVIFASKVNSTEENAEAITRKACEDHAIPFSITNGRTSINAIDSGDEYGWVMFYNDEMGAFLPKDQKIGSSDKLEWRYCLYKDVFAMQESEKTTMSE